MSSAQVAQRWLPYVLLLAIVATVLHQLSREPSLYTGWPPRTDSAPAQIQARELAVKPGEKFRGRGVVLLLMDKKDPAVWGEFFHMLYFKHRVAFGNDLLNDAEAAGVPIANHYAHWVSPPMLALFAAAFYRPEDPIDRASMTPRAYRPNLARLLGVALVVSDQPLPGETELYRGSAVDRPLYLHRVTGANLGQYSPTRTVVVASGEKILDQLLAKDFDGRNLAVLEKPLARELVPAEEVAVSFHKGPIIRVTARSRGTSLLVLPFDYSHCLEIAGRGVEQVLPVNLSQTGVVIGGAAAFDITYRYGLVKGPACRKQDLERIKALKLEDAATGRLFRDSRPKG